MKIDGECLIELIGSCRNKVQVITALPLDTYRTENPLPSRLCYRRLWGSRNRRALILGWAYYLDAFSSYPLRTWLPNVYRGHDNWYTRGASFPVLSKYKDKLLVVVFKETGKLFVLLLPS
ncbi:hypothetical protein GOBAR_DD32369 [Gossypium barbadense]|nr:hypothetical protein GOBAR_DD32369 [Gossypium barbadense]